MGSGTPVGVRASRSASGTPVAAAAGAAAAGAAAAAAAAAEVRDDPIPPLAVALLKAGLREQKIVHDNWAALFCLPQIVAGSRRS